MSTWPINTLITALGKRGGPMTTAEIAQATGQKRRQVPRMCCALLGRDLVKRPRTGVYELTAAGRAAFEAGEQVTSGPAGNHTGRRKRAGITFRDRVWTVLRRIRKGTLPDIVSLIADGTQNDPESNARKYLKALVKAGYVIEMARRQPGAALTSNGYMVYMLDPERDTGPAAPRWSETRKEVFDPNTGETITLNHEVGHG